MDMSYKGIWGYAPLLVTLANTGEILYTRNRPGNRPSHDGCFDYLDPAVELVREGGFKKVRLRGDGHFSLTDDFDHWSERDVEFVFGLAAHPKLVEIAEGLEEGVWRQLQRERSGGDRRARKPRVKRAVIEARGYRHLELEREEYAEFAYRPKKCNRDYRVVVLRKTINVKEGQALLIPEVRYHFYITNAPRSVLTARRVIRESNDRCNQENLIAQLQRVGATRMPVDTLLSNWAYMVMAALAWTLKAWFALRLPDTGRWAARYAAEKAAVLRMEFKAFLHAFMLIPVQVVRTSRRLVFRLLAWNPWQAVFLRGVDQLREPLRC
jgi:hypothetical protein